MLAVWRGDFGDIMLCHLYNVGQTLRHCRSLRIASCRCILPKHGSFQPVLTAYAFICSCIKGSCGRFYHMQCLEQKFGRCKKRAEAEDLWAFGNFVW